MNVELPQRPVPAQAIIAILFALSATLFAASHLGELSSFFGFALALALWTVAGIGFGRFFRSANPLRAPRSAILDLDEQGVRLDGDVVIARKDVTRGFVVPKPTRPLVRIEGKNGRQLEVEVPDAPAAANLLKELALDTDHTAVKLRVYAALGPVALRIAALLVSAFGALGLAIYGMLTKHFEYSLLLLMAQAAPSVLGNIEATLVIGKDGVHAAWPLGGKFLSFDAFDSVERTSFSKKKKAAPGNHLTVRLKATGARVNLDEYLGIKWPDAATCDAAAELVTAGLEAGKSSGALAARDVLARGNRTLGNWIAELKRLTRREGYRDAAVPVEQLLDVVEDATAAPALRLAAAIALRGDASSMTRVHAAASLSASPRIRIALESAVTAEDEVELGTTLESLESEARQVG